MVLPLTTRFSHSLLSSRSLKSHYCRDIKIGMTVQLAGWLSHKRQIGKGLTFCALRDETGTVQIKISNEKLNDELNNLNIESVISVCGTVVQRPSHDVSQKLMGDLEVEADHLKILNHACDLPFSLHEKSLNEETRLKFRHVDLRRQSMVVNMRKRQEIVKLIRTSLEDEFGFREFETPLLFKSTPEGASEFLVPANDAGYFYALPQSPQQLKQVLMAAGFERYYQIAKCFRNESQGANRQPEFTQIDLEMAFCTQDSIMNLIENLIKNIWIKFYGSIQIPFKRIDFKSAMSRYGSDKPDTRFDMEIMNLTENVDQSCFKNDKSFVEAILIPQGRTIFKEKELAEIRTQVLSETFPHLGPVYGKELLFVNAKNFLADKLAHIVPNLHIDSNHPLNSLESNDIIILNRRRSGFLGAHTILGRVRALIGALMQKKGMISSKNHQFLWVHSFPMFFPKMEMKRPSWSASHHPFTAPIEEHSELVFQHPSEAIGQNFDLVLNGIELGGGSIRIHNPSYQKRIFKEILGMPAVNMERDFGHLLQALSHGCPPHGGIALGLDRLTSVICDTPNIRDVIAFPKLAGKDIMMNSPSKLK